MTSRKMVAIECRAIIDEQLAVMTCEHEWIKSELFGWKCKHCGYPTSNKDLFELVHKEMKAKGKKR